jgi:PD-(D/E)XK nuclease superfamily
VPVHSFVRFITENTEHHGDPRRSDILVHGELTNDIIGSAIDVHQAVGPRLLESVYCECLSGELAQAGIPFVREVAVPVT